MKSKTGYFASVVFAYIAKYSGIYYYPRSSLKLN